MNRITFAPRLQRCQEMTYQVSPTMPCIPQCTVVQSHLMPSSFVPQSKLFSMCFGDHMRLVRFWSIEAFIANLAVVVHRVWRRLFTTVVRGHVLLQWGKTHLHSNTVTNSQTISYHRKYLWYKFLKNPFWQNFQFRDKGSQPMTTPPTTSHAQVLLGELSVHFSVNV